MASRELGALTIEPFEVSRWRGVSQLRSYGFSILGDARVAGLSSQRGALGCGKMAGWEE